MSEFDNFNPEDEQLRAETTEIETDKKCPNCGATVVFDPKSGKMHCDYCGYEYELPKPGDGSSIYEIDFESAIHKESFEWGAEKKTVECKNCGAVSIYDALETAALCPFCGSTHVMPAANENTIAPGAVCPFSITKEKARESFARWMKKKLFAPTKAKLNARPEAFQGLYLPYWTYDSETTSSFSARAGYDKTVTRNGKKETETTWRPVRGVYQEFFDDQTVVASKRLESSYVKACEPFDFTKMVPYNPKYIAGFVAERYSIGLKEGWEKAQKDIKTKLTSHIQSHIKKQWRCNHVNGLAFSTLYSNITYKYLLVPVWISSFKYNNKTYQLVVNGQTGKVGGKAPVSVWKVLVAITLGIGALIGLVSLLS